MKNLTHNKNNIFNIIFIIILFLPVSQMLFKYLPEREIKEQRIYAKPPDLSLLYDLKTCENYFKLFELFFNDHYGLRSNLIHLNSMLNIKLLNVSPRKDIIIGKNGWLFYDSMWGGISFKDFYGKALFTEKEMFILKQNLLVLKKKFSKMNIDLIFVIGSNKQSVYSEFLPDIINHKKSSLTRADQINSIANEIDIKYIDTRFSLLKAKKEYKFPLYYKTDTHWNSLGAYIAYEDIINTVSDKGYIVNDNFRKDLSIKSTENSGIGDLASFINYSGELNDSEINLNVPVNYSNNIYKGYTAKNGNKSAITKLNINTFPKVVMFGDSFSVLMMQFLSESFSEVIYNYSYTIDLNIIEKEKPDIVIYEFVERMSDVLIYSILENN